MIRKIIKEPLVHFLLGGFLLFIYFKSCGSNSSSFGNAIRVDKEAVLNYYQFQSRAFNNELFESRFDKLPEEEKSKIINSFIRDEVLFREATKLGLDQNDFVIKRRIIQKMEFILDDFDKNAVQIEDDSLRSFYNNHQDRYFENDQFTFTHIFFNSENRTEENALSEASAFQNNPKYQSLTIEEGLKFGDRFIYHRNYIDKDEVYLTEQFGQEFFNSLSEFSQNENLWQGPIQSEHGYHLIKLVNKKKYGQKDFIAIKEVVREDYLIHLKSKHKDKRIKKLIDDYNIKMEIKS